MDFFISGQDPNSHLQNGASNGGAVPIYDTINDDHSSGGASRYSGSDRYNPNSSAAAPTSTFKNGAPYGGYQPNHDYDTPEGAAGIEGPHKNSTVTINGIAV